MIKHTQTIRRQIADEMFECVWSFCEVGAKGVKKLIFYIIKLVNSFNPF